MAIKYTVKFLKQAKKEFDKIDEKLQIKFRALVKTFVNKLGWRTTFTETKHIKHLEDDIYEFRVKGANVIVRLLHIPPIENKIIIAVVFTKKTEKTPQKYIKIAKERVMEAEKWEE